MSLLTLSLVIRVVHERHATRWQKVIRRHRCLLALPCMRKRNAVHGFLFGA
jgi:hypothetical protein